MATIDVARYIQPLSTDSPCGPNLEYDPAFGELERVAEGKPEQVEGDRVIAKAEDPEWRSVFEKADALLGRSRDLRVALHLTHAALNLSGVSALAAGLALIETLLRAFWDEVHPQIDEDDKDPTLRINSLSDLESPPPPGSGQRPYLLKSLDRSPIVRAPQAGVFSYRDVKLARGDISLPPGDKGSVAQIGLIEAAFQECDLDVLRAFSTDVGNALATLNTLRALLREKVGSERSPEFGILEKELQGMQRLFAEQLARRGVSTPVGGGAAAQEGAAGPISTASGEIRTREDVIRILDRVSDYFQKYEPSSPVPLLLQRAKRLVAKDFMEILRDLAPAGVAQAEAIGGLEKRK
jgi:type VI secretion system protein ImpA